MKKTSSFLKTSLPILAAVAMVFLSVIYINSHKGGHDFSLDGAADNAHMLTNGGGELGIADELLDGSSASDNASSESAESKADSSEEESSQSSQSSESESSITESSLSSNENIPHRDPIRANTNHYRPDDSHQAQSDTDEPSETTNSNDTNISSDSSPEHSHESNDVSESISESKNESESSSENSSTAAADSAEVTDSQMPSDSKTPDDSTTDIEYFTTSINDGETVFSRDYSFTITQLQTQFETVSETVYVNGVKQVQFHGNVLLDEGANTIRIVCEYKSADGRVFSVFLDRSVTVDLGETIIFTDLSDCTVYTDVLSFSAYAQFDGKRADVKCTLNGNDMGSGESFSLNLKSGHNTIVISADINGHHAEKSIDVFCDIPETLGIYTDLSDITVHSETLGFSARILNGSDLSRITVTLNGNTLRGGPEYTAALKVGSNVIRIKVTDKVNGESISETKKFTIKYVPLADDKTVPKIDYINIYDGMSIVGSSFTLDILPVDYRGTRIYHNGITMLVNGVEQHYRWSSSFTSYLLYFADGENTIDIRITDADGRYCDHSYKVYCRIPDDGETIGQITFSIDANVLGLGYIIEPVTVDIIQGESGADLLLRVLDEYGFDYSYNGTTDIGFYLSRLKKNGIAQNVDIPQELIDFIDADGLEWKDQHSANSLGEFDYCQGSGWMYRINGFYPNYGFSDTVFKDGDVVELRFTLAYGKDIGGYDVTGGNGKNYDKTW